MSRARSTHSPSDVTRRSPAAAAPPTADWPVRVTDTVVRLVARVRAATTGRALVVSRAAVYLLAASLIGGVAAVLGLIMVFRLFVEIAQGQAWIAYLGLGALFTLVGLFAWAKKER